MTNLAKLDIIIGDGTMSFMCDFEEMSQLENVLSIISDNAYSHYNPEKNIYFKMIDLDEEIRAIESYDV